MCVCGGGDTPFLGFFALEGDTIRRGNTNFFNILPIMGHFQRAISPELLDLNPSFIYQNTHFNVLFKNAWVC